MIDYAARQSDAAAATSNEKGLCSQILAPPHIPHLITTLSWFGSAATTALARWS